MGYKLTILAENVEKISEWLKNQGGVAVWKSKDESDPDFSMSTPALTEKGEPSKQPHKKVGKKPDLVITDSNEIKVVRMKKVKRFRVAVRRGARGQKVQLVAASARRLQKELQKAGENATYAFDQVTQEAVISVPSKSSSLYEWMESN